MGQFSRATEGDSVSLLRAFLGLNSRALAFLGCMHLLFVVSLAWDIVEKLES